MQSIRTTSTSKLLLNDLRGEWYVLFSNFPMWLKGNKLFPRFNYDIEINNKLIGLRDEVRYVQDNKPKQLVGFDKPLDETNEKFEWRGKGLHWLIRSRWQIMHYDMQEMEWMVISFERTLFTPAGIDIISRSPMLPPKVIAEIMGLIPPQEKALQPIIQRP